MNATTTKVNNESSLEALPLLEVSIRTGALLKDETARDDSEARRTSSVGKEFNFA